MGAEDPAVAVQLVHHHEGQALEELGPLGVMGQDRLVEHVRVADDDVAAGAHRLAGVPGGISVEGVGAYAQIPGLVQLRQLRHLVLGQGLGGEEIERLPALGEDRIQHRQVVAECLAGGGGGGHDHMPAGPGEVRGLPLVGVEPGDAALPQGLREPRVQIFRQTDKPCLPGRLDQPPGDAGAIAGIEPAYQRGDRIGRSDLLLCTHGASGVESRSREANRGQAHSVSPPRPERPPSRRSPPQPLYNPRSFRFEARRDDGAL